MLLWFIKGTTDLSWDYVPFEDSTVVLVNGQPVGEFDADSKVSKRTATSGTFVYSYTNAGDGAIRIDDGSLAVSAMPRYIATSGTSADTPSTIGGVLVSCEPTKPRHVATKNYADTKVSKMTITNNTTYLYGANKNGDINPASGAAIASSYNTERYDAHVPRYIAKGVPAPVKTDRACLCSSEPSQPGHCATKNYVDTKIAQALLTGFEPHKRMIVGANYPQDGGPTHTVCCGIAGDAWTYQGFINFPVESLVVL